MRRAVAAALTRHLEHLREGRLLSAADEAAWVADHVRRAFDHGGVADHHRMEAEAVDTLVERAQHRWQTLRETALLRRLASAEPIEWLPLERRLPMRTENARLWTAPDLLVNLEGTWQLVRFAMEVGKRRPAEHQRLELGLLLDWALREASLPADPAAFRVQRIAWRWNGWVSWSARGSATWVEDSRALLDADLRVLRRAHLRFDGFGDLDALDTAVHRRTCAACGFHEICPASRAKPVTAG